ncbi:MAG TPA: DUF4332 domain-containing protein [Saprospiraceae bacterium]|nr:DUF4332 domain-containing protein [Saprospiraceae bacterium]
MVVEGNIIDAFDLYFHDQVVTHSDAGDRSKNKAQKREWLVKFFQLIQKVDKIELYGQTVTGNVSHSKFSFHFTTTWGAQLVWKEIIRRTWKDDLVIDEYYYEGELPETKKEEKTPSPAKKAIKKAAPKKVKEATPSKPAAKKTTPKKVVAQKVVKKAAPTKSPAKKAAPKITAKKVVKKAAPKKPDDLKKIEGIGPKIAQLLTDAGISTFAKLATAKQDKLKAILAAAGNRYKMHNPATWPEQANLAKNGQWDELKKLQDRLDGGRR